MTRKLTTLLAAAVLGATAASTASASVSPNPLRHTEPSAVRYSSVQYTHPGAVRYGAGGEAIRWSVRPTFRAVRF